jgi:hypothetical protein
MIYSCNVAHALLYTVAQYFFYEFMLVRSGKFTAFTTMILLVTNELISKLMVRTFSNSIEACLLMIGLYFYNKLINCKKDSILN